MAEVRPDHAAAAQAGDPNRVDLQDPGRATALRPAVRVDPGLERHNNPLAVRLSAADGQPPDRAGFGVVGADVHHRDGGFAAVHPAGRRQPTNDGGGVMSSQAVARGPARMRTRTRAQAGRRRTLRNQVLLWVGVVATILFCLFPFYWIINTSLKTGAELSQGSLFPHHPSLDNYSSIFKNSDFTTALRTSLIDAGAATLIALSIGSFAAYALARLRFPRK